MTGLIFRVYLLITQIPEKDCTDFFVSNAFLSPSLFCVCNSVKFYVSLNMEEVETVIYKGIANGKTIKLEESLPYPKGQQVINRSIIV